MISYPMTQPKTDKTIVFELTITSKEAKAEYQKSLKKAASQVEIKGFRKGKAPLDLVEKELSVQKIYEQIIQNLLPAKYEQQINTLKVNPIIRPQIVLKNPPLTLDKDWLFEIKTCQKPEITLKSYSSALKTLNKEKFKDSQEHNQKIIDLLVSKSTVSIPKILTETQVKDRMVQLIDSASSAGMTLKQFLETKGTTIDKYQETLAKNFETDWKISLSLDQIAHDFKIEVSQAEVQKTIPKDSQDPSQANLFYFLLKQNKTLDFLRQIK